MGQKTGFDNVRFIAILLEVTKKCVKDRYPAVDSNHVNCAVQDCTVLPAIAEFLSGTHNYAYCGHILRRETGSLKRGRRVNRKEKVKNLCSLV